MTRILIVRHGESEANKSLLLAGHANFALTALGHEQARQTAEHLECERIDAIYASDLDRALDTAKAHAVMRGLPVVACPELREIYCGAWEGMHIDRARAEYGELYRRFCKQWHDVVTPQGEGVWESGERFYQKVLEIAKKHDGGTVLIASHGAVIRSFWAIICGTPREKAPEMHAYPSNASYSEALFDGERILPIAYSLDSHLTVKTELKL